MQLKPSEEATATGKGQDRTWKALKILGVLLVFAVIGLVSMSNRQTTAESRNQLVSKEPAVTPWEGEPNDMMDVDPDGLVDADLKRRGIRRRKRCPRTGWTSIVTTFGKFYPVPSSTKQRGFKKMWKVKKIKMHGKKRAHAVFSLGGSIDRLPFYDRRGKIVGMIVGVKKVSRSMIRQGPWTRFTDCGKSFWGIQFFFRNPYRHRCARNRSPVGYGLWYRQKNSRRFVRIPFREDKCRLDDRLKFERGGCINGMGVHYWRHVTCTRGYPVFPMYHKGTLVAVGVQITHNPKTYPQTKYWETGTVQLATAIGNFSPKQVKQVISKCNQQYIFKSMHVMFGGLAGVKKVVCPK